MSTDMIIDATYHLNGRSRGAEARLARLAAGGVPTDRNGMSAWLSAALDAQLEAARGVYHAETARISSGVSLLLPRKHGVGCRISRASITAHLVSIGDIEVEGDDDEPDILCDDPYIFVRVGNGYYSSIHDRQSESAEEAVERVRAGLLASGAFFRSREEARIAVELMLETRIRELLAAKPRASRRRKC